MQKIIISGLIIFLLYTNSSFRSYTIEALQSITNLIKELPDPETKDGKKLEGESTY